MFHRLSPHTLPRLWYPSFKRHTWLPCWRPHRLLDIFAHWHCPLPPYTLSNAKTTYLRGVRDGSPHSPNLRSQRWFPSLDTCYRDYGVQPNCTIIWAENGISILGYGETMFGEFEGDPDLAGIGVCLQTTSKVLETMVNWFLTDCILILVDSLHRCRGHLHPLSEIRLRRYKDIGMLVLGVPSQSVLVLV